MISKLQQQQLEKYVNEFQSYAKEGTDPQRLHTLLPEFYHFVGGCKKQVKKAMELAQDLKEDEIKAAEGLLNNLNMLHTALLETSHQLGISLETKEHMVSADHRTQEIRINFERCHKDSLKNIVIQAIRDTLDVEAPLADSGYTVEVEPDNSISIRVIHYQKN
jgi:DNA polymerase III gamma/tau subunit